MICIVLCSGSKPPALAITRIRRFCVICLYAEPSPQSAALFICPAQGEAGDEDEDGGELDGGQDGDGEVGGGLDGDGVVDGGQGSDGEVHDGEQGGDGEEVLIVVDEDSLLDEKDSSDD